ncbi:MAG: hypothetical protein RL033_4779 [Pseudomonadota bacterium]|jgi:hypothetical protein
MKRGSVFVAVLLVALPLMAPLLAGTALAAEEPCRVAYVETQRLQRAAQLRAARRAAVACGQDECSSTVRAHCSEWLASIERALPTLLIDARDPSGDAVVGVRVQANDELLSEGWDGRALELDPGEYTLRFSAGTRVVVRRAVVREGEKYHRILVQFEAEPSASLLPASLPPTALPGSDPAAPPPLASYVLGGLGLTGLAGFTVLGVSGYTSERRLRERCAGACSRHSVDSVRLRYLLADAALGVGAASGIAAAAFWLWTPGGEERQPALALGPGSVQWQGEF